MTFFYLNNERFEKLICCHTKKNSGMKEGNAACEGSIDNFYDPTFISLLFPVLLFRY